MTSKVKSKSLGQNNRRGEIITIHPSKQEAFKVKTCAYIRVSSNSEEQQVSYASQFNNYAQMIRNNPDWEFAGVYADEGITGTNAEIRPEFQRMIADCKKGKIDRIIAKSISRFARNVADMLETVRELGRIGITFYFEKESIDTAVIDNEMLLIILSSIAESESVSISQNQKFGIQHRMQTGTYIQPSLPYGYKYDDKKQPVIIESQAVVVKRIFSEYLSGNGMIPIVKRLNKEMIPPPISSVWHVSTIIYILNNSFYIGDALWQKEYTTNTIPFHRYRNNGEKDMYLVKNHHEAIIPKESFQKAQDVIASRQVLNASPPHPLSKKMFCPYCHRALMRKNNKNGTSKWMCRTRFENAKDCRLPMLSEDTIQKTIHSLFIKLSKNADSILLPLLEDYKGISEKTSNQGEIAEIYAKINRLNEQAIVYAELKMQEIIPEEMYQQEVAQIQYQIKQLKDRKNKVAVDSIAHDKMQSLERLIDFISDASFPTSEVTKEMLELVDKMVVNMDETISIHFKDTITITGGAFE